MERKLAEINSVVERLRTSAHEKMLAECFLRRIMYVTSFSDAMPWKVELRVLFYMQRYH